MISCLAYSAIIYFTYCLLPGIHVESSWTAVIIAIILSLVSNFVKPFLILAIIPITILTLAFFLFIMNISALMLVSSTIGGFVVVNFWWATLGALIVSMIYSIIFSE